MPETVCLIRHAEKQLGAGPPLGVTADGRPDPRSLTPRGWQRAGALVTLFGPGRAPEARAALPTPARLLASGVGPHSESRRPIETLQPLSERLGLTLDEPFLQDELDQLATAIRASEGHVLVAWEHKRIPLIAKSLSGDAGTVPAVWPDDRYDVIWVLRPDPSSPGVFGLTQIPEMLLAGDRVDPID